MLERYDGIPPDWFSDLSHDCSLPFNRPPTRVWSRRPLLGDPVTPGRTEAAMVTRRGLPCRSGLAGDNLNGRGTAHSRDIAVTWIELRRLLENSTWAPCALRRWCARFDIRPNLRPGSLRKPILPHLKLNDGRFAKSGQR
jgi:hypothetical protein